MEEFFHEIMAGWPSAGLVATLIFSLVILAKAADWLVEEAVSISLKSGMPPVVVGATVVSLGTTSPEAFVSVLAAVGGDSTIALGNAVGSIVCDTGLILGLACLISPLPFDRKLVNRQGWVQFGSGVLLVGLTIPWHSLGTALEVGVGGILTQVSGFLLVFLLIVYLIWSVRMAGSSSETSTAEEHGGKQGSTIAALLRMLVAVALVLVSAALLISAAKILAERMGVPPGVVAATMIAFGTSLPELIIVLTAVRKGQPEIAIGNVVGADILNVLFVAGVAAAVTPAGLVAGPEFFKVFFPGMLFLLLVFRIGIWLAKDDKLARPIGAVLLMAYLLVQTLGFLYGTPDSAAEDEGEEHAVTRVLEADELHS